MRYCYFCKKDKEEFIDQHVCKDCNDEMINNTIVCDVCGRNKSLSEFNPIHDPTCEECYDNKLALLPFAYVNYNLWY